MILILMIKNHLNHLASEIALFTLFNLAQLSFREVLMPQMMKQL